MTRPDPSPVTSMHRPPRLVVVAGTGTEVGKTWVACRALSSLAAAGVRCAARKPAQSFDPADHTTDAAELAAATGEDPALVCPPHRSYEVPMAPPMAADSLGRPRITTADLAREVAASWDRSAGGPADSGARVGSDGPARAEADGGRGPQPVVGLVELAGGIRSPQAHDGDGLDLLATLRPDHLVIVADAGLGVINAVMTTLDALHGPDTLDHRDGPGSGPPAAGAPLTTVHLNRFDPADDLHRRNADWLGARCDTPLTTDVDELARVLGEGLGHDGSAGRLRGRQA